LCRGEQELRFKNHGAEIFAGCVPEAVFEKTTVYVLQS